MLIAMMWKFSNYVLLEVHVNVPHFEDVTNFSVFHCAGHFHTAKFIMHYAKAVQAYEKKNYRPERAQ